MAGGTEGGAAGRMAGETAREGADPGTDSAPAAVSRLNKECADAAELLSKSARAVILGGACRKANAATVVETASNKALPRFNLAMVPLL